MLFSYLLNVLFLSLAPLEGPEEEDYGVPVGPVGPVGPIAPVGPVVPVTVLLSVHDGLADVPFI